MVDLGDHVPECADLPYGVPTDETEPLLCDPADESPFDDTSMASPHTLHVGCAAALGLVSGGPVGLPASQFGPTMTTSRAHLATLVANPVDAVGGNLPQNPTDAFTDDQGSVHELAINQLAAAGIIGGNGESGTSYFPSRPATRAEMASFMRRLLDDVVGHAYGPGPDAFGDDDGTLAEDDINVLAGVGVISGKAPGVYDPDDTINREQIATFFVRLIGPVIDGRQN